MIFVGIDPGQKGAIGIIDTIENTAKVFDMPEHIVKFFIKLDVLEKVNGIFCILEKAQSMPGQGRVSIMTYGIGYGEIRAALQIGSIPFQEVHPATWKAKFSLTKKGKEGAVKAAQQLFPLIDFYTERGRMLDGRAEAMLLADYARRIYHK